MAMVGTNTMMPVIEPVSGNQQNTAGKGCCRFKNQAEPKVAEQPSGQQQQKAGNQ